MKDQNKTTVYAAATLLLFLPIFSFLNSNYYPIVSSEVALIFFICGVVCIILPVAAFLLGNLVASLIICWLLAFSIETIYVVPHVKTLYACCLLFAVATYRQTSNAILVGCSVFVISALAQKPVFFDRALQPDSARPLATAESDKPFILHIVLDEHLGFSSMQKASASTLKFSKGLLAMFRQEGFQVYENAYSQYWGTENSIPNLLNLTSSDSVREFLRENGGERSFPLRTAPDYSLNKSEYFRQLSQQGYNIRIFQSQFMDFCNVKDTEIGSCFTYGGKDIDVISRARLPSPDKLQIIFRDFIEASKGEGVRRLLAYYNKVADRIPILDLPKWKSREQRGRYALASLEAISLLRQELETAENGEMIFAHLLIPHFPYIFYPDCSVRRDPGSWLWFDKRPDESPRWNDKESRAIRYEAYAEQLQCSQQLLVSMIDALKKSGRYPDATVVIHGDHGSRIYINEPRIENLNKITQQDLSDAYSTLFVLKRAGAPYKLEKGFMPLQKLLSDALMLEAGPTTDGVYLNEYNTTRLILLSNPSTQAIF